MSDYKPALVSYIRTQANPPDKFSHQARLYQLATRIARQAPFDEDVVFAAAWMHDLGVFIGHRPEEPEALKSWDHLAYTLKQTPYVLRSVGFPESKIPGTLDAIRTHMPSGLPTTFEATLIRDADILEQLGAVAVLRTVSKVGRDSRFVLFSDALSVLRKNSEELPGKLRLAASVEECAKRVAVLHGFLEAAAAETGDVPW